MIQLSPSFLTALQGLPAEKQNRQEAWFAVLDSLLGSGTKTTRVLQWGTSPGTERILRSDRVERLVACESDAGRFEQSRQTCAAHLDSGKLVLHHFAVNAPQPVTPEVVFSNYSPNHDFVMQPLRQLGENAVDLAILHTDVFATDCAEIAQLLVKDGGLILWIGMTSWSDPTLDYPSNRTRQEVAADFAERYYLDQHQCLLMVNRKGGQEDVQFRSWADRRDCLARMFRSLDQADVEYLLLSNPGNLPAIYGLKSPIDGLLGSAEERNAPINPGTVPDIDLLVARAQFSTAKSCIEACGLPPEPGTEGNAALYGAGQQKFFFSQHHVIRIHLFDGLQYTSLDRVHRVCLHANLQEAVIARRRYTHDLWRYSASANDSLLHNLCRCLFDKRGVPENYAILIEDLYARADLAALRRDLESVFFKFAGPMEFSLQTRRASELYRQYIGFQEY